VTDQAPPEPPPHPGHPGPAYPPPYGTPGPVPPYGGYGWAAPPPGPAPGLKYAGFWIRFAAQLIDSLILFIPIGIIFALAIAPTLPAINCTFVNTTGYQSATCTGLGTLFAALGIWWLVALIVPAVYAVVLWSWQGQTLGQKLLGLHVVDAHTGTRISVGRAVIRYIGFVISAWVLYIGLIWAAFDAQKQGWHDKMASTFVVQRV
jgi:uncharacterized RDD family membrane protein YckC